MRIHSAYNSNILVDVALGWSIPRHAIYQVCSMSIPHRSGVSTPDHGVIYDRDLPTVNMWSTAVRIELGHLT